MKSRTKVEQTLKHTRQFSSANPSFWCRVLCATCVSFLFWNPVFCQQSFFENLADSAIVLTYDEVTYDPSYYRIDFPGGDVPADKGVCTDVVIRVYRKFGIDLQKEVHEDMINNFHLYPDNWGLSRPDPNIDHRRVPNLMKFFERNGTSKSLSKNPEDYLPGDIVCWRLTGGMTHIGIVVNQMSSDGSRHLIVHNIGAGQVVEDCLFDFEIIGHYIYRQ